MSDRSVRIAIEAVNKASAALKQIGADADAMGNQVEQAGQRGARSLEDLRKRSTEIGAAIGAGVAVTSLAGQAYLAQEQQLRGLQRAYGDSADDIAQFAEELQNSTTYSNDAGRAAAQVASTLTRSYGLTADQVQQLIARTADLATINVTASGSQFDLVDAVSRTAGAIRGEGEAAEALGLTLSDSAVAAAAAARGLTGWTTTMSESEKAAFRFTLLMEQSTYAMGAASEAADTNAGKARQLKNDLQDLTQSFGGALGAAGEYSAVLGDLALIAPVVGAALGKIGAGLAAAGLGPGAIGPAALIAGGASLAYGYSQNDIGTTDTNAFWNNFFLKGSQIMNWALPGDPYDEGKYINQMNENAIGDLLAAYFALPGTDAGQAVTQSATSGALGQILFTQPGVYDTDPEYIKEYIRNSAEASGMRPEAWLQAQIDAAIASNPDIIRTPTGQVMTYTEYGAMMAGNYTGVSNRENLGSNYVPVVNPALNPTAGTWRTSTGVYMPREFGANPYLTERGDAVATSMAALAPYSIQPGRNFGATTGETAIGGPGGGLDAGTREGAYSPPGFVGGSLTANPQADLQKYEADARAYTDALKEQTGAYYPLIEGVNSAHDAQVMFWQSQQNLMADQQVYSQQLSEYTSQENSLTAAYDLLMERQAAGIALSREEQELIAKYPELYERVTGGQEDAIIAGGLLAAQYIENMKKGDELNASMQDQTTATGDLVNIIEELILSLDGIPPEVRSRIEIENAIEAQGALAGIVSYLNSLDGRTATFYVNAAGSGVSVGNPNGPSITPEYLGGVVGYAGGGMVLAQLAEAGAELLHFQGGGMALAARKGVYAVPEGTFVDTAPVTRSKLAGAGGMTINGNLTIQVFANDAHQMQQSLAEWAYGGTRA